MDEMEEMDREELEAVVETYVNGAVDVVDWNVVFDSFPIGLLLSSLQADPGSASGIPSTFQGSGSA